MLEGWLLLCSEVRARRHNVPSVTRLLQARTQASVVWEGDLMLSERAAKGPSVGLARVRAVAQQHIWSPGQPPSPSHLAPDDSAHATSKQSSI